MVDSAAPSYDEADKIQMAEWSLTNKSYLLTEAREFLQVSMHVSFAEFAGKVERSSTRVLCK